MWFNKRRSKPRVHGTPSRRRSFEALEHRRLLSVVPNDPHFHQQWGLDVTEAAAAWEISTGSTLVSVAVIDSGVDYTHPDLYKNIWLNQEEIPTAIREQLIDTDGDGLVTFWDLNEPANLESGLITDLNGNGYIDGGDLLRPFAEGGLADGGDNGGNGYVDDLVGWDFFDNDNDPIDLDPLGHGTPVAGIIGAVGNNGIGIAGINWKTQIMPLRNHEFNPVDPSLPGLLDKVIGATIDGSTYALQNGARVVNISGSAPQSFVSPELVTAANEVFTEAAARDVLVVAAAGNQGLDTDVVPFLQSAVAHENVIIVAATFRQQDRLADFGGFWASNYGATTVDLGAPGDMLWSTEPVSRPGIPYEATFGGTSGATPFVAGAAALILSVNPNLSFAEVKSLILDNVDPTGDLAGKMVTGGRLNIYSAVSAAANATTTASDSAFAATGFIAAALDADTKGSSTEIVSFAGCYSDGTLVITISGGGRISDSNNFVDLRGRIGDDGYMELTYTMYLMNFDRSRGPRRASTYTIVAVGYGALDADGNLYGALEWSTGEVSDFLWARCE